MDIFGVKQINMFVTNNTSAVMLLTKLCMSHFSLTKFSSVPGFLDSDI